MGRRSQPHSEPQDLGAAAGGESEWEQTASRVLAGAEDPVNQTMTAITQEGRRYFGLVLLCQPYSILNFYRESQSSYGFKNIYSNVGCRYDRCHSQMNLKVNWISLSQRTPTSVLVAFLFKFFILSQSSIAVFDSSSNKNWECLQ